MNGEMSVCMCPLLSSFAYRVGPELDDGSVVEGIYFPGYGQLPGANVCLHVILCLHMVMGSGLLEHILQGG